MRLTLESTDKVVTLQIGGVDVPVRVWQGDYAGVEIHAFISHVAVPNTAPDHVHLQFERELIERAPIRADVSAIPLWFIL